jgi:hypothetical protein
MATTPAALPPRGDFTAIGSDVLRDGQPFITAARPDIALALELTLNDAQLLFWATSIVDQEFVERTLWS